MYAAPTIPFGNEEGESVIVGHVGEFTVNEIDPLPERAWASLTVNGKIFAPADVASVTVAEKEKILSPEVTSPCVASS